MSRAVSYEVGVTFCTGTSFAHDHLRVTDAAQEYATMLGVGVEPELMNDSDRHVRMVTMIGRDEAGEIVSHISSPIFECDHRVVA